MDTSSAPEPVTYETVGSVGVLTLDAPQKRNPLSVATMTALTQRLVAVAESDVQAVVLASTGPVFSAGHHLREMVGQPLDTQREVFDICTELMETIHRIPQPVVAAVTGSALAAGCQLVATCDLAVASSKAVFGTPGVKIGLFCSTPMVAVSRAIGRKRALQMLMTGDVIDAATAADWGLVNEVVEPDQVLPRALELAGRVATASPLTLKIGKQAFYDQIEISEQDAYVAMKEVMAQNAMTADAQEGMTAFLDKRQPTWSGR